MRAEFTLERDLTEVEFVEIYRLYGESYGIKITERDELTLTILHYQNMLDGGFDCRPMMGAKFLGDRIGADYSFHGYKGEEDEQKDSRFVELVNKYSKDLAKRHLF